MFFDGWEALLRVVVVGTSAYVGLIVLLRVSGKRTLAKLNAFDLVVTVAIGSTLATALLSSEVSLAEGLSALALLVGLQYAVAWSSHRSVHVERVVKSEPTLIYHRGLMRSAMQRERITEDELRQAARRNGYPSLAQVEAIVLETDGSLSVLSEQPPAFG